MKPSIEKDTCEILDKIVAIKVMEAMTEPAEVKDRDEDVTPIKRKTGSLKSAKSLDIQSSLLSEAIPITPRKKIFRNRIHTCS